MKLDPEMSTDAAAYAMKLAKMGTLKHSDKKERGGDGENLAFMCSPTDDDYKGEIPTADW